MSDLESFKVRIQPARTPINRHPIRLTEIVEYGKVSDGINLFINHLNDDPNPQPKKISKISFTIIHYYLNKLL